jgi:murein DD-endopeptidase MepM/ murein hydrolase activator NlpD
MRACEVVPLAWDATGSVRDRPQWMRTGHRLSTGRELTVRDQVVRRHLAGMKLIAALLATLALSFTATPLATAAPPPPAVWPLQPRPEVVRGFELPAEPWLPGHRGIDLLGTPGQPVLAATSGTIKYAGQLAGRGVVVVTTGARRTTYEPVVPVLAVGAPVQPGTVIAHLSAAGSHCSPRTCLHWGLLQGKQYVNPLTLLPQRPVRLLPLAANPVPLTSNAVPLTVAANTTRVAPAATPPPRGERTGAVVVAATAALTLAGGLMIRRH